MRIQHIYISNSLGIYMQSGRTEVVIDMSQDISLFLLLNGGSGSGKSTFGSCISPRPYPVRSKADLKKTKGYNIPGKKMVVEVTYEKYKIRKIYQDTSSSFYFSEWDQVSKTFIERNTNGTVSGYKQCMLEYWGLVEEHLRVLELSTETNSLVDETATERKKTLNGIMIGLEEYNDTYELCKTALTKLNTEKRRLSSNIAAIGDKTILVNMKSNVEKEINTADQMIEQATKLLAQVEMGLRSMPSDVRHINIGALNNELKHLTDEMNGILNVYSIQSLEELNSLSLKTRLEEVSVRAREDERSAMSIKMQMDSLSHLITTQNKQVETLQTELQSASNVDVSLTMGKIENARKMITVCEQSIPDLSIYNRDNPGESDAKYNVEMNNKLNTYNSARSLISDMTMIDRLEEPIDDLMMHYAKKRRANELRESFLKNSIQQISDTMNTLKDVDLDSFTSNDECPRCPLFKKFSVAITNKDDLDKWKGELVEVRKTIDEINSTVEDNLRPLISSRSTYINIMNQYGCTLTNYNSYVSDHIAKIYQMEREITNYKTFRRLLEAEGEVKMLEMSLDGDSKTAIIKDKITSLISSIEDNQNKILNLREPLNEHQQRANTTKIELRKCEQLLSLFRIDDRITEINKSLESVRSVKDIKEKAEDVQKNIDELKKSRRQKEGDLMAVGYKLKELSDADRDLAVLKVKIEQIKKVQKACCPINGIPAMLINGYLGPDVITKVNDYLVKFFPSDGLILTSFQIYKREFNIFISGGERPHEREVSNCSKSERRSIGLALSFALQEKVFTNTLIYNIPMIDEMDDGLDEYKRQRYMDIVEKYFRYETKIDQVILITHNNNVEDSDSAIILFPGSSIVDNMMVQSKVICKI